MADKLPAHLYLLDELERLINEVKARKGSDSYACQFAMIELHIKITAAAKALALIYVPTDVEADVASTMSRLYYLSLGLADLVTIDVQKVIRETTQIFSPEVGSSDLDD